jgi:Cdc6-like AAA superfamily ATPase
MNLQSIGRILCKVEGGKLNNKIVSVSTNESDDADIIKKFNHLELIGTSKFQQIPDPETSRSIGFITGASGSGKSTYIKKYVKEYQKAFKKNPVYLLSALKEDESLDDIKPNRIKIDDELVSNPIDIDDFKDSMVVFDDIDVIRCKKQREAVYDILNQVLEVGRHHNISCWVANHLPTAGKDTRRILNEAHFIVYFPHAGSAKQLNYLLMEYIGMDKKEIRKIKKMKTRWCCVFKNYPQIAMTEKQICLLCNDDD